MKYYHDREVGHHQLISNFHYLKAPVLELGPAAAHVGCVLPDHLGVVADAPAALLTRPGTTNIASLQSEHAEYNICK